jgi:hypothetical protein
VDTQLADGSWGYPGSIGEVRAAAAEAPEGPDEAGSPWRLERRTDPVALSRTPGDLSNTQFAILALRAVGDARIEPPEATWQAALDHLLAVQREDGGWGYVRQGRQDDASYASLTAASVVSVALCLNALGRRNARTHAAVRKGLKWLDEHWRPDRNAGIDQSRTIPPLTWQLYHLYAIERVGSVLNRRKVAGTSWFAAGAEWLLGAQHGDGRWEEPRVDDAGTRRAYLTVADTCFGILFLARATPPLTRR